MKIQPSQNYGFSQSISKNKTPNFGLKLVVAREVFDFVEKEAANSSINCYKKFPGTDIKKAFVKQIDQLKKSLGNVGPKDLQVRLGLTQEAEKYAKNQYLDGKCFDGVSAVVETFPKIYIKGYKFSQKLDKFSVFDNPMLAIKNGVENITNEFVRLRNDVTKH